jgi:hypothetical protein
MVERLFQRVNKQDRKTRMREKEPQFTVTDRRKFTAEGELREGESKASESAPPPPPPAAAKAAPPIVHETNSPEPQALTPEPPLDDEDTIPEPSAAETAKQRQEYHTSAGRLDEMFRKANPGQPALPAMNFDRLVQSLYMTAAVQMGAGTGPNEQPRIDIIGARQSIDMLNVLEEKTKGNLSEEEKRLLQNALFDLRMSFLEITNAIASSAQRPPQGKKLH